MIRLSSEQRRRENKYQFLRGALNQYGFAGTALLFNLAARAGGVSGVRQATGEHASCAATIYNNHLAVSVDRDP